MRAAAPPLGLYVHLPWCVRKCPYCDFNSYELRGTLDANGYVEALLRDLDLECGDVAERTVGSIFIGGGTPSLFPGQAIAALLDGIRARMPMSPNVEISLEANPGAVEAERFVAYRAAGVNRISIGVQSFRDAALRRLGRVHSPADACAAVATARRAGFDNLNLDLMYGLPDDSPEHALADLEQALELEPSHLSWYQLTLEPGTQFERFPPQLPDDDVVDRIETRGRELLAARGFRRYEISAYARPGHRCRHNLNYWRFGDYIGIGAGAHGKLSLPGRPGIERRARTRNPRTWAALAGTPGAASSTTIESPEALLTEFCMNALRLVGGVPAALLAGRTGVPLESIAGFLEEARGRGWLSPDARRIAATPAGLQSLNRLLALL